MYREVIHVKETRLNGYKYHASKDENLDIGDIFIACYSEADAITLLEKSGVRDSKSTIKSEYYHIVNEKGEEDEVSAVQQEATWEDASSFSVTV